MPVGLLVTALAAPAAFAQDAPDTSATTTVQAPAAPAASATAFATPETPNPHPVTAHKVRIIGEGRNVVREGPGEHFALAGVYDKGAIFPVIAKSGPWYNIRLSDTETAWIHADLCQEFEDMGDLEFRPNPKLYTRTGSYVVSAYAGGYAFDRKSNSLVVGMRLGYYVFDRLQAEAGLSYTHISRPAEIVESLFGLTLEAEKFHMLFYNLNFTYEVLPGRQMVPFLTVGVGSSIMRGDTEPSFNFGAGTQLFLSKRTATRWEVRDYRFSTGAGTSRVTNSNIEFTLATSYLF
jgi:outer membrane beta-barrel protein